MRTRHRRRPTLAALLVIVALSGTFSGCLFQAKEPPETDIAPGSTYVAIGDSYTSAPRVGPPADNDGCLRTTKNYPRLVAKTLRLKLVDVSCGGASTENLTSAQDLGDRSNPPQIDALTPDTDLVTVSLGGNDGKFFANLASCVVFSNEDGSPCADQLGDTEERERKLAAVQRQITANVTKTLRTVATAAPDARILVVGYPQFAPRDEDCEQFPLADGDIAYVYDLNVLLNDAVQDAADEAGAEFVDLFSATSDHNVCSDDPWVAGATPEGRAAPYHPYPEEQEAAADAIIAALETD